MKFGKYLAEKEILNEAESYAVIRLGGSIGGKSIRSLRDVKGNPVDKKEQLFSKADAKAKAKRLNKSLSPGEKKYYGIKYVTAEVQNKKFTGK